MRGSVGSSSSGTTINQFSESIFAVLLQPDIVIFFMWILLKR